MGIFIVLPIYLFTLKIKRFLPFFAIIPVEFKLHLLHFRSSPQLVARNDLCVLNSLCLRNWFLINGLSVEVRNRSKDDFRSPDTALYDNVRCCVALPDVMTNVQMDVIINV